MSKIMYYGAVGQAFGSLVVIVSIISFVVLQADKIVQVVVQSASRVGL